MFNIKGESPSKNIKTLAVIIPTIGYNLNAEKEIDQPIIKEKEFQDAILPSKNIHLLLQSTIIHSEELSFNLNRSPTRIITITSVLALVKYQKPVLYQTLFW